MATTEPRGGGDKPVSETRQGNKDKFAWFYAMLADRKVTNAGKAVGAGCVMKLAGSKGHFKATRKAIANLCGMSQATARLGLASLIDNRYLRADLVEGAASTYYLIHPDAREQLWLDAERDYKRAIHEWLYAEKWHNDKQVQNQLLAEKQFRQFQDAVFKAAINRGIPDADAHRVAGRFLEKYGELGYELDPIAGAEAVNSL